MPQPLRGFAMTGTKMDPGSRPGVTGGVGVGNETAILQAGYSVATQVLMPASIICTEIMATIRPVTRMRAPTRL